MRFALLICLFTTSLFATEYKGEVSKFIEKDVFTCPSTGVKFKSPDLGTNTLQVQYQEVTPGITWQLVFAEELGHVCVVKYSKIRNEYPKTDKVLERIAAKIKGYVLQVGGYVEWCGFLSDAKGKALQCIIRYPDAGQTVSVRNKWLKSMESVSMDVYEIRHYLVRDGFLIEYKYYIPQMLPDGSYDEDKFIESWMKSFKGFVEGSSFVKSTDNYGKQLKDFVKPKSYFRFVFKDPSQN